MHGDREFEDYWSSQKAILDERAVKREDRCFLHDEMRCGKCEKRAAKQAVERGFTKFEDTPGWQPGKGSIDYKRCQHAGEVDIYKSGRIVLSGGSAVELEGNEGDLVIDLAGGYSPAAEAFVEAPENWLVLNKLMEPRAPVVRFKWKDYRVPPVGLAFWKGVWKQLRQDKSIQRVVFACGQGHGRTGTAIAAMMVADGWEAQAAIKAIRKVYCERAVETKGQEVYLEELK